MKKLNLFFILLISLTLYNCVGEDIIQDAVAEEIRFLNAIENIEASKSFQLETRFFNKVGEEQDVEIDWTSENPLIATVSSTGLVSGVSEGTTNIVAKATVDNEIIENKITITITPDTTLPSVVAQIGTITILNPIATIEVSETHLFNAVFLNDLEEEENIELTWWSDTPEVATISIDGLITGISAGTSTIKVTGTANGEAVEDTLIIRVNEVVQNLASKTGTIITTSSYVLEGDFTLSEIANTNNLELSVASNYRATTSLPGLYVYLSNNPNSIANAFEIGAVETFNGEHSYTLTDKGINDYAYVLYWCKPFGVKVGQAQINN